MLNFLRTLDRRWIFLTLFLLVSMSLLFEWKFPEVPSQKIEEVFQVVEDLPPGTKVLLSLDFDPASQGELWPMAAAFTRHCCERKCKIYFITLWPFGEPMIDRCVNIVEQEYKGYRYGHDYVNLGYKPGAEGNIQVINTNFDGLYTNDKRGTPIHDIPMFQEVRNVKQMDLLISVSAGSGGAEDWIRYAASPNHQKMLAGVTGVQAPFLQPYVPNQLAGMLGGIKGAAEYEVLLLRKYEKMRSNSLAQEGLRRMGPQLIAHLLIVGLIVLGNVIFFLDRRRAGVRS